MELLNQGVIYNILGVGMDGRKDLIGLYSSENEGAKFWLSVLTDLKQRGIEDILIACIDGLKGFSGAIEIIFSKDKDPIVYCSADQNKYALCNRKR